MSLFLLLCLCLCLSLCFVLVTFSLCCLFLHDSNLAIQELDLSSHCRANTHTSLLFTFLSSVTTSASFQTIFMARMEIHCFTDLCFSLCLLLVIQAAHHTCHQLFTICRFVVITLCNANNGTLSFLCFVIVFRVRE